MWLLNLLPSWVAYLIILIGVFGVVASYFSALLSRFIPIFLTIKLPLRLGSVAVILFGTYLAGGIANQAIWEARVKEMEEKVKVAEQKAKETNTKIETKFVDKVKVVQDVQVVVQEKIKEVEKIIDAKCEVPKDAISLLNAAAQNKKPENKK